MLPKLLLILLRALAGVVVAAARSVPCMFDHHRWTPFVGQLYCTRCGTRRPLRD